MIGAGRGRKQLKTGHTYSQRRIPFSNPVRKSLSPKLLPVTCWKRKKKKHKFFFFIKGIQSIFQKTLFIFIGFKNQRTWEICLCQFTLQRPTLCRTKPGWSQQVDPSGSLMQVTETQVLEHPLVPLQGVPHTEETGLEPHTPNWIAGISTVVQLRDQMSFLSYTFCSALFNPQEPWKEEKKKKKTVAFQEWGKSLRPQCLSHR